MPIPSTGLPSQLQKQWQNVTPTPLVPRPLEFRTLFAVTGTKNADLYRRLASGHAATKTFLVLNGMEISAAVDEQEHIVLARSRRVI